MKLAVVAVLVAFASDARGDTDEARTHFDRGQVAYNLGNYTEAIADSTR